MAGSSVLHDICCKHTIEYATFNTVEHSRSVPIATWAAHALRLQGCVGGGALSYVHPRSAV